MIIPKEINGYTLTAKERKLFIDHDLSRNLVSDRIRKGWERERWFEAKREYNQPLIVQGHVVSEERQKLMKQLGINTNTAGSRMIRGMTFDEATTTPPSWVEMKMPKQEVIEVIGRIKYLNKQPETIYPYCIPLGVRRRAKEYGIDIDSVQEIKVIDLG